MAKKTTTPSLTQKKLQAMLAEAEGNLISTVSRQQKANPTYVDTTRLSGIEKASQIVEPLVQQAPTIDPYYAVNPKTGLSPAQVEAEKAQKEATTALLAAKTSSAKLAATLGADIDPNTGKIIPSTIDPIKAAQFNPITGRLNVTGSTPTGNQNIDTTGTTGVSTGPSTNVDVLKSMLRGLGFNSAIIDSSTSFLMSLLKDGLDYDNAVAIFLNAKDYTLKDGKKVESPFYAEYSYLNEGLVRPKSASELYNAVEGYKEVAARFNLNTKFTSKDYMKDYVKNNITVANLAERANLARLKSVNADPAYIDSLRQLGYITSAADLTDFFLDPKIGEETLIQRRSVAAFGAEAIKRAKQGVQFATSRFDKIVSGLLGMGLSPEQVELRAAQGFENIGESLMPTVKLGGIYERTPASAIETIQSELETEEFSGLASERRKRLSELEKRSFQAQSGTAGSRSFGTTIAGLI